MEITSGLISEAIPYVASLVPVIITQIVIYNKLKWDVQDLKKSVNGIGVKVNLLKEEVGEEASETILRFSDIKERITRVETLLDVMLRPKTKNGHA
jgi:hypothetical protein